MRTRQGRMLTAAIVAGVLVTLAGASSVGARSTAAPVNVVEPVVTGTYVEGDTLTTTAGTWSGTQPITYAGQWVRCNQSGGLADGSDCVVIAGANGPQYTLKSADVGSRLRIRVTATNFEGSATVASNATPTIQKKAQVKPTNTKAPAISGSAVVGSLLKASTGTWTGDKPIIFTYTWARCNTAGGSCAAIVAAGGAQYIVTSADAGKTLRVQVTAINVAGSTNAVSAQTRTVQTPPPPPPAGVIQLPSGEHSIPVTSVTKGERLVVANVAWSSNPVTTRDRPITVRIRVKDTRGYVVRGAIVFIRSTPRLTTGGDGQATATDGWVSYNLDPFSTFPLKKGYNVQFFIKAYRIGDPELAGVSNRRLVQVATS